MPCISADCLTSRSTVSIDLRERDIWTARTDAMFPVSETAALIASARSCPIVQTTALAERPSRKIAAHQRRRSGIVRMTTPAAGPDTFAALSCRAKRRRKLPNIGSGPIKAGPSTPSRHCGRRTANVGLRCWVNRPQKIRGSFELSAAAWHARPAQCRNGLDLAKAARKDRCRRGPTGGMP